MTRMRTEGGNGAEAAAGDMAKVDSATPSREGEEVFVPLIDDHDFRFGVSVLLSEGGEVRYTLEGLISVLHRGGPMEFAASERALWLAREMEDRGYTLTHNDDGWIICEKDTDREGLGRECAHIQDLMGRSSDSEV